MCPPFSRTLRRPGAALRRTPPPLGAPLQVALLAAVSLGALPQAPGLAAAQLVDNGTFRLLVDGAEAGKEEFTVQRVGAGDAQRTFARGSVRMRDGRVLDTVLQLVGPAMVLQAYRATLAGADTAQVEFVRVGDRLQGTIVQSQRERLREYRADPAAVILEDGVAHHYFVLGAHAAGAAPTATVHVFAPLSDRAEATTPVEAAPDALELNGTIIETTRVRFGTGDRAGAAWFDGSGRLVRVELFARGFVALRLP